MFEELLGKMGRELDSRGIPYMVIGGQAVLLYGEPRLTRDIDVTLGVDEDVLETVLEAASRLGLEPIPEDIPAFVRETMVLPSMHRESGIRVDFIFSRSSYEREAIKRSRRVMIGGEQVAFASLEDLVIHKIIAGRPRDIEDARIVLIKNPDYDRDYILKWLDEFDAALGGGFRRAFEGLT